MKIILRQKQSIKSKVWDYSSHGNLSDYAGHKPVEPPGLRELGVWGILCTDSVPLLHSSTGTNTVVNCLYISSIHNFLYALGVGHGVSGGLPITCALNLVSAFYILCCSKTLLLKKCILHSLAKMGQKSSVKKEIFVVKSKIAQYVEIILSTCRSPIFDHDKLACGGAHAWVPVRTLCSRHIHLCKWGDLLKRSGNA